ILSAGRYARLHSRSWSALAPVTSQHPLKVTRASQYLDLPTTCQIIVYLMADHARSMFSRRQLDEGGICDPLSPAGWGAPCDLRPNHADSDLLSGAVEAEQLERWHLSFERRASAGPSQYPAD